MKKSFEGYKHKQRRISLRPDIKLYNILIDSFLDSYNPGSVTKNQKPYTYFSLIKTRVCILH